MSVSFTMFTVCSHSNAFPIGIVESSFLKCTVIRHVNALKITAVVTVVLIACRAQSQGYQLQRHVPVIRHSLDT